MPRAVQNERSAPRHLVRRMERARRSTCSCRSTRSTPTFAAAWSATSSAGATCRRFQMPAGPTLKPGCDGRARRAAPPAARPRRRRQVTIRRWPARSRNIQASTASRPTASPAPGRSTSLNRGARYYERLIIVNLERARRLPLAPRSSGKYMLVDVGAARGCTMWENGRVVDSMKVIVGKAETATPMMAALDPPRQRQSLLERPARAGDQPDRAARRRAGHQLSDRARVSGAVRLRATKPQVIDPDDDRLAGGRRRPQGRPAPPAAEPGQFDGHDEIHAAQRLRHLPPRHAGEGRISPRASSGSATAASGSRITSGSPAGCSTAGTAGQQSEGRRGGRTCRRRCRST